MYEDYFKISSIDDINIIVVTYEINRIRISKKIVKHASMLMISENLLSRLRSRISVDVVYDAVGLDTYVRSMNSLRPRGLLALYGEASGLVPPIDPRELLFRKSLYLTRTGLDHYIADRRELMSRTNEIFTWMAEGRLKQQIFRTYRLDEVAYAHRALEGRESAGKLLVIP